MPDQADRMTIDENQTQEPPSSPIDDTAPWPKWRVRLSRLSPYTMDIEEQLERLYELTIMLTIVPGVMAAIILTIFTLFGRPDVGAIAVTMIFGPMIGLAWRDYRRINRQARLFLASQTGE
jgi:hypothetical protein